MTAKFERVFRLATWSIALLLGWFALATMFAEASKTAPALADWATAVVPLRGDLLADLAANHAAALPETPNASAPTTTQARATVLSEARQSLYSAPHLSRTWLLIANLERSGTNKGLVSEALRMSYLTAPADMDLIPERLRILSVSTAIDDADDIKGMARNDIRLILTRRPDLKPALITAYRQGSPAAKTYFDEVVTSLDPDFAVTLRQ